MREGHDAGEKIRLDSVQMLTAAVRDETTFDQAVDALKFLSDNNRLRILAVLTEAETCVCDLIDELDRLVGKNNWDVLFTDQNYRTDVNKYLIASGAQKRPDMDCSVGERYSEKYTTNEIISPNFKKVSARFATHSMIIRRCGIEKLLKYSLEHKIYLPYDQENYFAPELKRYSFTFDVVSNMFNSVSDNAEPTYKQ